MDTKNFCKIFFIFEIGKEIFMGYVQRISIGDNPLFKHFKNSHFLILISNQQNELDFGKTQHFNNFELF